jgi:hypothetical protein
MKKLKIKIEIKPTFLQNSKLIVLKCSMKWPGDRPLQKIGLTENAHIESAYAECYFDPQPPHSLAASFGTALFGVI